jgi:hypothetical protein
MLNNIGYIMKNLFYMVLISLIIGCTNVDAVFFTVEYTNQNQLFQATFNWSNGIIVQYDNKRYTVAVGKIYFDMQQSTGNLSLGSATKGKESKLDAVMLKAPLNKEEFEHFANEFNPGNYSKEKEIVLSSNIKSQSYDAIKNLMQKKFPGLTITIPQFSWRNFAKSYWKPILGGLSLAGAGLFYIYYDIKTGKNRGGWSDSSWHRRYPWQFWRPTTDQLGWN